jgi:hypothetical protein
VRPSASGDAPSAPYSPPATERKRRAPGDATDDHAQKPVGQGFSGGVSAATERRPHGAIAATSTPAPVAVAAVVFVVGYRIGTWVAPSANRPDWSPGSITLELHDPALGVASGVASCSTSSDGSFSVGSDPVQSLAGTPVDSYVSGPGPAGQDRASFEL